MLSLVFAALLSLGAARPQDPLASPGVSSSVPQTGYFTGFGPQTQQSSNYDNTVLPLKVAGGVGLAAGFGLSQVLNGK